MIANSGLLDKQKRLSSQTKLQSETYIGLVWSIQCIYAVEYEQKTLYVHYSSECCVVLKVIVERYKKEKLLPPMDKSKFLLPEDLSVAQFSSVVRSDTCCISVISILYFCKPAASYGYAPCGQCWQFSMGLNLGASDWEGQVTVDGDGDT